MHLTALRAASDRRGVRQAKVLTRGLDVSFWPNTAGHSTG
jgi:hypothetical protein